MTLQELREIAKARARGEIDDWDYVHTFSPATVLKLLDVIEKAVEMREHNCHGEYTTDEAKALIPAIDAFDKAMEALK